MALQARSASNNAPGYSYAVLWARIFQFGQWLVEQLDNSAIWWPIMPACFSREKNFTIQNAFQPNLPKNPKSHFPWPPTCGQDASRSLPKEVWKWPVQRPTHSRKAVAYARKPGASPPFSEELTLRERDLDREHLPKNSQSLVNSEFWMLNNFYDVL